MKKIRNSGGTAADCEKKAGATKLNALLFRRAHRTRLRRVAEHVDVPFSDICRRYAAAAEPKETRVNFHKGETKKKKKTTCFFVALANSPLPSVGKRRLVAGSGGANQVLHPGIGAIHEKKNTY